MVFLLSVKQLFDNERPENGFFLPWLSPPQVRSFLSERYKVARSHPPHNEVLADCHYLNSIDSFEDMLKTRLYPVTMPFNPAMSPSLAAISK